MTYPAKNIYEDIMEAKINISRPLYDKPRFDAEFERIRAEDLSTDNIGWYIQRAKASFVFSRKDIQNMLLARVPFIKTLRTYNPQRQFVNDVIGGLSVGVIHIPQGMGFAIMAGVPPVYGLYGAFWPAFLYVFFGTGHHISMGTMALISLMIRVVVDREVSLLGTSPQLLQGNHTMTDMSIASAQNEATMMLNGTQAFDLEMFKIHVVMSLTLLIGIMQFVMGVLHLGVLTTFMPSPFIGGMTTGAAFHIVTSQLKSVLGITWPSHEGIFGLPLIWVDIIMSISKVKIAEAIIATICMTTIILIKTQINNRFKDRLYAPVPPELIIVIIACIVSHFGNLAGNFNVRIINDVPSGMAPFHFPPIDRWPNYIRDAFMISLISFSIAFSMGSLFGGRHDYAIEPNQELIAIGLCHGIGSLFGSFAGAAAPPRCLILDRTGATTQVSGVVTSIFLLAVIFLVGKLFEPLPNSVLGAIIIVAVLPLFEQFLMLKTLWRISKYDFAIWLVSWMAITFIDISMGLIIGIAFGIATIIFRMYRSNGVMLTTLADDDIFVPGELYRKANENRSIQVFQFQGDLNFVSQERFKSQLSRLMTSASTGDAAEEFSASLKKHPEGHKMVAKDAKPEEVLLEIAAVSVLRYAVFDLSHVSYIDVMGITTLMKVQADLAKRKVVVLLACVSENVMKTLQGSGLAWKNGDAIVTYLTLLDAVAACKQLATVRSVEPETNGKLEPIV